MSMSVKPKTSHQFFSRKFRAIALSLCLAGAASSTTAIAQATNTSSLTVIADRAKVVRIAGEISSIIVGNPSFADVSVQKDFIIVHGRNFGQTNILVLDEKGETLANLEVTTIRGPDRNISVYRGGQKASYACAPKCESTLQVGDSKEYFNTVKQSIDTKMDLANRAGKLTSK